MDINDDQMARTLGDVLTEHLMREEQVHVPGLGTFRVEHRESRVEAQDGEQVMLPPADVITFEED